MDVNKKEIFVYHRERKTVTDSLVVEFISNIKWRLQNNMLSANGTQVVRKICFFLKRSLNFQPICFRRKQLKQKIHERFFFQKENIYMKM